MLLQTRVKPLNSIAETGRQMARLATFYNEDVKAFDSYSLEQFYNMAKSLTYKKDPPGVEHLSRPQATLSKDAKFRDCDDKAILIGAYLFRKKIPFRFVATSTQGNKAVKNFNGNLHHVLVEALINGNARFIDATYPHNELFKVPDYTNFKPITNWIMNING